MVEIYKEDWVKGEDKFAFKVVNDKKEIIMEGDGFLSEQQIKDFLNELKESI